MDIACTVNNELEKLDIWFRVNKLSLNVNKTNVIMFTNKKQHRPKVNMILNGTNIEQVSHTTFLGVIIDENLTWREQIKTVETKVSTSIGVLYKTKDVLDIQALRTLYQSLVEPYMSYCCEMWGNTYPYRLRKLSLLQKKAIQIIYSFDYHGHTSVFFHCSKILKLQDLITHKTMVTPYKANNHCLESRVQAFFEPTAAVYKHDTRQSKLFYVKKANTTHRLLSITVRGIHVCNGLASNITQLPSLQQFKKSLKSTLLSSYL